jgi:hypothetical protein
MAASINVSLSRPACCSSEVKSELRKRNTPSATLADILSVLQPFGNQLIQHRVIELFSPAGISLIVGSPDARSRKAMKGYHYSMRLAHAMNALAQHTQRVARQVRAMGLGAFLSLVRETCAHRWLSRQWCRELLARPFQLRLE